MANKTVSNLNELTTVSNSDVLLVETATETLKVTKGNLLKEVNEQLNAKSNASHTHDEYVTENELNSKGLATETFVTNKIAEASLSGGEVDLSGYATEEYVNSKVAENTDKITVLNATVQNHLINHPNGSDALTIVKPVFSNTNPHATNPLDIETYAGGENQPMHPKVLYFENKWNGYKYWMAYTPLPNEDNENPCIAVSNDMINWTVPSGLENPLAWKPSTGGYNSDTHLVYVSKTDTLECWYRRIYTGVQKEEFFRRTSKDGVIWTTEESCFMSEGSITQNLSPAIIFEENKYKMWTFASSPTFRYYESENGKDWTKIKDITLNGGNWWHGDVIHTSNGYEMLLYVNSGGKVFYTRSADNETFQTPVVVLEPTGNATDWDSKNLYRSSFFIKDGFYYIFYSGQKMDTNEWKIGLTRGTTPTLLNGLDSFRNLTLEEAILDLYDLIGGGASTSSIPVESVSLNKNELSIKQGDTFELIAGFTPINATNKTITWSSSNHSIATVTNGIVKGIANGNCVITATSNNGKSSSCNVTVAEEVTSPDSPNTGALVQEGLIAHLDARDGSGSQTTWNDRTANGNDFELFNFKNNSTSGWDGASLIFNGIDNYCEALTPTEIKGFSNSTKKGISFCITFTPNSLNGQQDLFDIKRGNKGRFLILNNKIQFQQGGLITPTTPATFEVGKTYDCVFTYYSSDNIIPGERRFKMYINGESSYEYEDNIFINYDTSDLNMTIGSEGGTLAFANMKLHSIKIYNRELTLEEVLQNYEYEKSINR